MSIERLTDQVIDTAVDKVVHNTTVETAETVLKAASDMPGHVGTLAGKLAEVIDDVQELVGDVTDIVKEVVDIIVPDSKPRETDINTPIEDPLPPPIQE